MTEVVDPALATAGKTCNLGSDPAKYLEVFETWYEHVSLLADSIGVKDQKQKLLLVLLWGGKDFRKFTKDAGVTTNGDTPDTLEAAIKKIRDKCSTHVNLSMAMFKLMHARQGTRSVTEFRRELDELATQCQFDTKPYNKNRAMKDAFIFGTADDKVRQEALAKDLDYDKVISTALGYEQSRKASGAIKSTDSATGESVRQVSYTQDQVDELVSRVMAGKYSARSQNNTSKTESENKCKSCPPHYRSHPFGKCPLEGRPV